MRQILKRFLFIFIVLGALATLIQASIPAQAQEPVELGTILGLVYDRQDQPIKGAHIRWKLDPEGDAILETVTQADGVFALTIPQTIFLENPGAEGEGSLVSVSTDRLLSGGITLYLERAHFKTTVITIEPDTLEWIGQSGVILLPDTYLDRRLSAAFWIATLTFIIVLILIATGKLHNTLAALLGTSLLYAVSYLGHPIYEDLFIFDFANSLSYIDWNVIFLIMGMMIVIAVVERTGIFQWLAFFAYRISRGRMLVLLPVLMLITGIASAFLDNVTTMLLMTPITIQIAISMGVNPLALLIPEVMASNVVGISTLIGTPTNILIGSYAGLSFNDFLVNLTPGVLLAFVGLVIYCYTIYRRDLKMAHEPSPLLLKQLEERGRISEPKNLKKAGWIGFGMLLLFMFGERVHLLPAVTALMGATALMVWIRPNIEEMIEAVDWTTLVFFIGLFIVVGAIQEVGLISFIATIIGDLVGENLILAMMVVVWVSAVLSTVIANIPFTAAMLPVIGYLTAIIPGAQNNVLFYCLSVGSAMGGNGSLIGASANMVTSGIAERAGYNISYVYFLKKGLPALIITVALTSLWLLIRFL